MSGEHEQYLVSHCGQVPIFITDFPTSSKPFYAKHNEISNKTVSEVLWWQCSLLSCSVHTQHVQVASLDLLVPGAGEIVGGTLRENNYHILKEKLERLFFFATSGLYVVILCFVSSHTLPAPPFVSLTHSNTLPAPPSHSNSLPAPEKERLTNTSGKSGKKLLGESGL